MLTAILVFFVSGILIGPLWLDVSSLLVLSLVIVTGFGFLWTKKERRALCLLFVCFFFGIFRYQESFLPTYVTTVTDKIDRSMRIEATIDSDVEARTNFQQAILSDVRVADETVSGKILTRFPLYPNIEYGDRLLFTCLLEKPEPFNGFAYDRQLRSRGVLAICPFPEFVTVIAKSQRGGWSTILALRDQLISHLRLALPEPHASFISGLIFGGSSSLSTHIRDDFSRTGLSHILAASGFNVSLFSLFLLRLLLQSPLGRSWGLLVSVCLLVVYIIAAGATPAVVRAAIMACVLMIQMAIRRKASQRNMLLMALALMLLINPQILLDDVGFQLSFVATAALLFLLPHVEDRFLLFPQQFGIRTLIASSCVAIVATLPILLWHFGELSLMAPIANALILPFVPVLMALGVFALTGISVLALPAYGLASLLLQLIHVLSSLPFASFPIDSARTLAIIFVTGACIFYCFHHYARIISARPSV